jgi:uncharacterized protein RhaS with RHS repeats
MNSGICIHIGGRSEAWTLRYIHHDHPGSIMAITNSSGSKVAEYSFDPWDANEILSTSRHTHPTTLRRYCLDAATQDTNICRCSV